MLRNIGSVVLIILVGLVAVLFQLSRKPPLTSLDQVQGRNNTALFIINVLGGLHNAQLATIQSLREKHPHIEVHVMSWAAIEPKVKRLFDRGDEKGSDDDDDDDAAVRFHALAGQGYVEAVFESADSSITDITDLIAPPTVVGWFQIGHSIQAWMSPWSGPAYLDLVHEMGGAM
ncbi:glycosyltransferase family 1 protein [Apiospora saccharicola]